MKNIINRVNEALDKFTIEKVLEIIIYISYIYLYKSNCKDVSTYVKKKCDEELGGTWHCIVGRNFGCSITHDTKFVVFFQVDLMHVLLFKSLD